MSSDQKFVVRADAICGAGKKLEQGDEVAREALEPFVEPLLKSGAIAPVEAEEEGIIGRERRV